MRKAAILACVFIALGAEARTIRGRVTTADGTPLEGTRVMAQAVSVSRCCGDFDQKGTIGDGTFTLEVDPGVYVVWANTRPPFHPVGRRVDVSGGDVAGVDLIAGIAPWNFLPDEPPRAALIRITSEGEHATFRGDPGAVPSRSFVMLTTLETGDFTAKEAAADGSFEVRHYAPPGTSVQIKADPVGLVLTRTMWEVDNNAGESSLAGISGTIMQVPAASGKVENAGVLNCCQSRLSPTFTFSGTLNTLRVKQGDSLRLQGTIRSESPAWANTETLQQGANLRLELLSDATGETRARTAIFSSTLLTPTGLAIERMPVYQDAAGVTRNITLRKNGANTLQADIDVPLQIAPGLPRGRYRAVLDLCCENEVPRLSTDRPKLIVDKLTIQRRSTIGLAIVEVAEPPVPTLHWTLLVDELAGGSRGIVALEDRGRYAVASRILTESESGVVPRLDERTGAPIFYRIEPYALTVSAGDRAVTPSVPNIIFRFPSGSLRAEIRGPDGSIRRLGPYPFVQSRSRTLTNRVGKTLDAGGGHLTDAYQLSTMRPEMEITFDRDGEYVITLDGEIEDIHGNVWRGHGTYPLFAGSPLIIDPAVLPGTPFEVGDALATGATIIPPVAADVDVRLRFVPRSDTTRTIERVFSGRANRMGYFHAEPFTFTEPGEYRLDVTTRYRDERGALWYGVKTSGSAVAPPNAALIARGRRGVDNTSERPQWFARPSDGSSHMHIPWASGDVMWQTKEDSAIPLVTVQDPSGRVSAILQPRATGPGSGPNAFAERVTLGEIPLFSSVSGRAEPYVDPSRVDLWGYSYRSVQRPLVRVREEIGEEVTSLYWRFRENYAGQRGIGSAGDLKNDFKFQYGATVLRGPAIGEPEYAIYGSFFVLIGQDDPIGSRVFPPFQGNAGGPSGGPLFTLKGRPIDIFLHPTAVRPGSILQLGEMASFAGHIAPTLKSKYEFVITAPSGTARTISGQANAVGYVYQPANDFRVNETGVWRVRVKVWHDGLTSAGQTQPPFPTGESEFNFYVVDARAAQLDVAAMPAFVRPADGPIDFTFNTTLTNAEMQYTVTMPGFILEEGRSTQLRYTYDAAKLARDFPNLDLLDEDAYAGADIITMSFLVSGTDATGSRRHIARQIVIDGERLLMPAQPPAPARRRSARR